MPSRKPHGTTTEPRGWNPAQNVTGMWLTQSHSCFLCAARVCCQQPVQSYAFAPQAFTSYRASLSGPRALPSSPCRFVSLGMSQSFGVGTPPTGRGVSPVPRRRSSAEQRSSVVPFTRPVSTGKLVDNHNSSFEKSFRHSLPSHSQPVASRPSFTRVSFDTSKAGQVPNNSRAAATLADSPFSKQDGFSAAAAPEPAERDILAGLGAPLESPGRTKSTSLLSQQLNRELSLKRSLETCHDLPAALPADLKASTSLGDLQAQYEVFQDEVVLRAFAFASNAHAGQQRRNGEPVFVHCVETAKTLAELGLTADVVAAGLLHDVLDDTRMTEPQLHSHFASSIVDMVCKVSRMSAICQLNRDQQADKPLDRAKLADTLMCMADPRCVLIKLADRLHNMRTLAALPEQKRQRMAQETMDIFSPLANRLGVWSLKAELEDLCFQQLHPIEHAQLQERLKESQHRGSIELALNKLSQHLDCIDLSYKELSGRPKNLWGVRNKMQRKCQKLDSIYDLRAIRVIVRDKTDCYAVLRQVHNLWRPVDGRFKDYIQNPKTNGYRSLHTVVVGDDGIPVEVQIRTTKMHFIAEHGLAAHWRYKEGLGGDVDEGNYLAECHAGWARYVLTWQMQLTDSKVRPSGSPGRDSSLLDLMDCPFPEHSANCKFVAYMNQIKPIPVSEEVAARYPINIFLTYTKAGVRQHTLQSFPPACTPATLATMMQTGLNNLGDVSPYGVRLLVNNREVGDLNKPLSFGDFVEVVPNESAQPYGHHPVQSDCGSFLHPKPQRGGPKHRPPVEQQRQQLNSLYRLHSDTQHSPTDTWRVSSTKLTTPPQRHGAEGRRPVPSG